MKNLFSLFLFSTISWTGITQTVFIDGRSGTLDADRYEDVRGDPYYFESWTIMTIYDTEDQELKGVSGNFNGYTGEIEAKKGDRIIELDKDYVNKVIFHAGNQDVVVVPGKDLSSDLLFVISLFDHSDMKLAEEFFVTLLERTINSYGENKEVKRFARKSKYVLIQNGRRKDFKMKKKDFLKEIGADSSVDAFIDAENLKMKDIQDYIDVLSHIYVR